MFTIIQVYIKNQFLGFLKFSINYYYYYFIDFFPFLLRYFSIFSWGLYKLLSKWLLVTYYYWYEILPSMFSISRLRIISLFIDCYSNKLSLSNISLFY